MIMLLDGHIHIWKAKTSSDDLAAQLSSAGVDGGLILSLAPASFVQLRQECLAPEQRIEDVLAWCEGSENLFPFYWIDPTEPDAADQVALAVERGIRGFKIICDQFHPGDARAMKT